MKMSPSLGCAAVVLMIACAAELPETSPEDEVRRQGLQTGSFTAELDGVEIHYEVHGRGPVLMVVPNSWGLDITGLRGVFGELEEKLTLVYFDPRGMGGSDPVREPADLGMAAVRADFDDLRRHLGLERVDAIGWSNGASNLIYLAAEHPDSLASAIFVHGFASYTAQDAAAFAERYPELLARYGSFVEEMKDESLTDADRTARLKAIWLGEFFPLMLADREADEALLGEAFGPAEFSWPHSQHASQESSTFDARDQLAGIPVRSLVLAGAYDSYPPEKVRELAEGLPDATFVVFEASGHLAPLEEPATFAATVYDFLGVE